MLRRQNVFGVVKYYYIKKKKCLIMLSRDAELFTRLQRIFIGTVLNIQRIFQ